MRPKILTIITTVITALGLFISYITYTDQNINNETQQKYNINFEKKAEADQCISDAVKIVNEGLELRKKLVMQQINNESVKLKEKERSFRLIKKGLKILYKYKDENNVAAIKCLIKFYQSEKGFEKEVIELQNHLGKSV